MKNPRVSRNKKILKIGAEINAKVTKETIAKINKAKSWFFKKWNSCPLCLLHCRQIIYPQFIVIHTVKGFGIVNKTEIDAFLELSCFFHDPADVGNLT